LHFIYIKRIFVFKFKNAHLSSRMSEQLKTQYRERMQKMVENIQRKTESKTAQDN